MRVGHDGILSFWSALPIHRTARLRRWLPLIRRVRVRSTAGSARPTLVGVWLRGTRLVGVHGGGRHWVTHLGNTPPFRSYPPDGFFVLQHRGEGRGVRTRPVHGRGRQEDATAGAGWCSGSNREGMLQSFLRCAPLCIEQGGIFPSSAFFQQGSPGEEEGGRGVLTTPAPFALKG